MCRNEAYSLYLRRASSAQPAPAESPQGGNAARVGGCSGVMWVACPFILIWVK